jgi:hypothetical protein
MLARAIVGAGLFIAFLVPVVATWMAIVVFLDSADPERKHRVTASTGSK